MATTTPNYGWTVPTSTDLVKDGATAIETLGDAIDASMNTALGTKKAGMVLLNTTSFSAVSSASLPANTFTATYDNYRIILNCSSTAFSFIQIRLRAAGADNTTSNYFSGMNNTALVGGGITADPGGAVGNIMSRMGFSNVADSIDIFYDIYNPFATKKTGLTGMQSRSDSILTSLAGFFQTTTSFDSLSFIPSAGTITGSVSVYGYNK